LNFAISHNIVIDATDFHPISDTHELTVLNMRDIHVVVIEWLVFSNSLWGP